MCRSFGRLAHLFSPGRLTLPKRFATTDLPDKDSNAKTLSRPSHHSNLISRCPSCTLPYNTLCVCSAGYLCTGRRAGMSNIFPGKLSALCGGRRPVTWWSPGCPGGSPGTPNHWAAGLIRICMHSLYFTCGLGHFVRCTITTAHCGVSGYKPQTGL